MISYYTYMISCYIWYDMIVDSILLYHIWYHVHIWCDNGYDILSDIISHYPRGFNDPLRLCRRLRRPPLQRPRCDASSSLPPWSHQQIGVLLYQIIFISLYYTHYDTIIFHYDLIISLICLLMSGLLFFIISLAPKGLLFHLWQFYYFTYFYPHRLWQLLLLSHYYLHYLCLKLLFLLSFSMTIILLICFLIHYIYYCYYHTIMCIIFSSSYYYYYLLRKVLYRLFVSVSIILIMTIITLLFA